ncbi:unnamed protein product, partial [Rhizoctonia solani]
MARDLTSLVQTLQNHLPESKPNRMPYSIENVARAIGEQLAHIKQQQNRSDIGQVIRATDDELYIIQCYRRIETIFRQLQTDVSLSVWDLTRDLWVVSVIPASSRQSLTVVKDARLKDLKPVSDAWHNAGLSMNMQRRGCTPNTRVKILGETMTWTRDPGAAKIYWMNGMAGTGKTTIAYTLCRQLEESKQLGAGFFCSRALPDCRNVNKIVPTIAYQLARFSNPYQNELCEVLSNNSNVAERDILVQFRKLIVDPLMKVKDAIPADVIIVIDALDECDDIGGTQLVLGLLFEHAISLPIKFFVTSRPEPNVYTKITSSEDSYRFILHLHDIEQSVVQSDIHTYLNDELRFIEAESEEINRLSAQAGCLFIFAATVVRYIEPRNAAVDHRERLTTILDTHTRAEEQAYRELDGLYLAILAPTLKGGKGNETKGRRLVLHAVLSAREPLAIRTIMELTGLKDEKKVELALLPFRSLLRVSVDSSVVTTLHASFSDFMSDPARSGNFFCDLAEQNTYMAMRCFEIMKRMLKFNICSIETSSKPDRDIPDLGVRINERISSGLSYASRYWGEHIREAKFSNALANMLDKFLHHRMLFWMEVLNLKDWIGYGAAILLHALNLLLDSSQADLRATIQDSRNFITTYAASPASQSTPHIYISGLPQAPSHSLVREIYWPRTKGLFQTQGTVVKNRGDAALATWAVGTRVYTLALSKDGKRIASGSDDGSISVWDANKGTRLVGPLSKHQQIVFSVAFSPDGSRIASGSWDRTICISNAYTGDTLIGPLTGHTGLIKCLSFSSDGAVLASASDDSTIRIWDPLTGAQVGTGLTGHASGVNGVVFTSNGTHLVSCSDECTIRVWDWKTGISVNRPFEGHTGWVRCIALSPDDSLIAFESGSDNHTIRVWSIEQGKTVVGPLTGHTGRVISVTFAPDGKRIVSGSYDQTIRVWSSETGDMIAGPFTGHEHWVCSVLFSRDGTQVISGSIDGTIRVWDANPSSSTGADMVSSGHTAAISAIVISPDGTRVISGSDDHTICIWGMHDGTLILGPLTGHTSMVTSLACTHDSTCIISGSADRTVRTWDAHTGLTLSNPFARHGDWVWAVAVSPDGNLIASGADDGSVKIWNRHNGIQAGNFPTHHTGYVQSVVFSSDSIYLASGSYDMSVCLWDANTGSLVWRSEKQTRRVMSVGFSPNGKTIIACLYDGIVSLD